MEARALRRTNAVSANTTKRRLLLLGGMGGYFVLALAIPHAFTSSGLAFGVAYVVVVGVQTTLFTRSSAAGVVRAILRLAPYNLGSALVILVGGAVGGATQYILWSLAVAFEWLTFFSGSSRSQPPNETPSLTLLMR